MKTLFITATLAIFTLTLSAQQHGTPQPGQHDYANSHSQRMSKDLRLNDEQNTKLQNLNTTHYNEQMKTRQSLNNDASKLKEHDETAQKQYDKQLRDILDDNQYKQYETNRKDYSFQYNDADNNAKQGNNMNRSNQGATQPQNKR